MKLRQRRKYLFFAIAALASAGLCAASVPATDSGRLTADKTGQLSTSPGMRLHLMTDQGDVRITTQDSPNVSYRVHLETDSSDPDAQRILDAFTVAVRNTPDGVLLIGRSPHLRWGQHLWVTFEVTVPRKYDLDISTNGGGIHIGDIDGQVLASTDGGDISTGQIGPARLVTDGGSILVKGASGSLTAQTGGGDVSVGSVDGTAMLRTGGGHIRVASITGAGRLDTGGGNIYLEHAGSGLIVSTGGGDIEVGDASGVIHARTGGGGIRVVHASGPTELETGAGNVSLMQIESAVRASTGSGGITAWFGPDAKLSSLCSLEAGEGDIVVYLPKELPITIDALVELGGDHRVIVDPAFPLHMTYGEPDEGSQVVRAEGPLNGGGPRLVLRTVSGNIHLILNDNQREKQEMDLLKQQMDKLREQLEMNLNNLKKGLPPDQP